MKTLRQFTTIAAVLVTALNPLAAASARAASIGEQPGGTTVAGSPATVQTATLDGRAIVTPSAAELKRRTWTPAPFSSGKSLVHNQSIVTSVTSGNWSSAATWGGSLPTAADDVVIADGTTVTIDTSPTVNSLTVGQGVSGVLQYEQTTARTLTVTGNVTISAGGTFQSNTAGTQTGHVLSAGANLTNNGTLDFSTNANTAGAGITFTGATSNTFSGTGATTDVRTITLNKGASPVNVLEISTSAFTVLGASSGVGAFVTLSNGTIKWSGTFSLSSLMFSPAAYFIGNAAAIPPTTGGLWLNNPNLTVVGQNGSPTLQGMLRVTQGTLNIGTATGNAMGFTNGAQVIVEGGAINSTGRFATSAAGNSFNYTQTGGTITVCTVGNTSTTLGSFDLGTNLNSIVNISGGTIVCQLASTAASGPRDFRNQAGTGVLGVTGGTLQLGNAASGTAKAFTIGGVIPNLVLTNTSANHTAALNTTLVNYNNLSLNITINTGNTLNLSNVAFLFDGTSLVNNGTLTHNGAASVFTTFNTLAPVSYSGTGVVTAPMTSFNLQSDQGFTISPASSNIAVSAIRLFDGSVFNSNKFTLGTGTATASITQIGNTTSPTPAGSFDTPFTFNLGTGGQTLSYLRTTAARSTGPEVNPTRSIVTFTQDDTASVPVQHPLTIAGGDITAATTLALTNGRVVTGANTMIANGTVTRTTGFVEGNLRKPVTTGAAVARTFEVGTGSAYTPATATFASVTGAGTLTGKSTAGDHPNVGTSGLNPARTVNRYYTLTNAATVFTTADIVFTFVATDVDPGANTANFVVRKFDSPNWTTTGTGTRTATTTQATGVSGFSDFQIGEVTHTITASAAAGGAIAPSGSVTVSDGGSQTFTITPDGCHAIADVLVDGSSVGAVASYTFSNVTVDHTIAASFTLNNETITASAGANGSISPSGATSVGCGGSQTFTFTPNSCYQVADVVVDASSRGASASYAFTNVTANHTISVSFGLIPYTITASAGPNGSISPNGAAIVLCGGSQTFTVTPNSNYYIADVLVDGSSVGAVASYTFSNVTANHTIAASFAQDLATITVASTPSVLCPTNTCVTLPVTLSRLGHTAVRGYSVTFQLSPQLTLCAGTSSITEDSFLSAFGSTFFQVTNNGGGSYTVDDAGTTCGPTGTSGALFSIAVASSSPSGPGSVTITSLKLRNCSNALLSTAAGPPGTVPIDNAAPVVTVTSPNGGETWTFGSAQTITWTATDNVGVANVDIDYSTDGGATYPNNIATGAPNTGSYAWTVPATATTQARVRVTAHDVNCSSASDASDANFTIAPPVTVIGAQSTTSTISPCNTCVTVPVTLSRFDTTPVFAFSVTFQLSAELSLCAGTSSVAEGTFLSSSGPTLYQVTDNGGGSYTADCALTANCGPTAGTGTLFTIGVTSSSPSGPGTITVTAIRLRDCANHTLPTAAGPPATVPIDNQAPAVTVTSPNGGETWLIGSSQNITWTATDNVAVTSVDLDYSTNGGATFPNNIATGIANTGSFAWTIPNTPTTQARVRVTAHDACLAGSDASDANFTIANPSQTIIASAGANGSISPSGSVSVPYGGSQTFTITPNTCYHVADVLVDGSSVGATTSYTFTNVTANHTIAASFAFNTATVSPVTGLSATQLKIGNDTDGTTKITLTFTAPGGGTSVEVWRKGFGGYPTYDNAGGSTPPTPGSYPPAGWSLTGVTTSGQTDEPATRDYWYYVAYAKDACGNVSVVSNQTGGTLDYHLGDVSNGITPGQGNNTVNTADFSLLGSHYGVSGGALAGFEYLDVGPTTDHTPNGRPLTDIKTDFEDLVMFALNFSPAVSVVQKGGASTQAAGNDAISLRVPESMTAGATFDVPVDVTGSGDLQALSVTLAWDASMVEPVEVVPGNIPDGVVLSPGAGRVDAAMPGAGRSMTEGTVATVRFRALQSGEPVITVGQVLGRNASNEAIVVKVQALAKAAVKATELMPVTPNPAFGRATVGFALATRGPVDLAIYSVDGRLVKTLMNGVQEAGRYQFNWNGTDERGVSLRSGMYFVRFQTTGVQKTRLITLMR